MVFSRDGSQVATFASGRVGRWDGRTGAFLGAVGVGDEGAVGFTDDGRTLRVADSSGRVRTWDLDPAAWTAAACRMAGRPLTEEEWRSHLPTRALPARLRRAVLTHDGPWRTAHRRSVPAKQWEDG